MMRGMLLKVECIILYIHSVHSSTKYKYRCPVED